MSPSRRPRCFRCSPCPSLCASPSCRLFQIRLTPAWCAPCTAEETPTPQCQKARDRKWKCDVMPATFFVRITTSLQVAAVDEGSRHLHYHNPNPHYLTYALRFGRTMYFSNLGVKGLKADVCASLLQLFFFPANYFINEIPPAGWWGTTTPYLGARDADISLGKLDVGPRLGVLFPFQNWISSAVMAVGPVSARLPYRHQHAAEQSVQRRYSRVFSRDDIHIFKTRRRHVGVQATAVWGNHANQLDISVISLSSRVKRRTSDETN